MLNKLKLIVSIRNCYDIIKIAKKCGKPVIFVVLCGSATALTWEQDYLDARWYSNVQNTKAITDILFGEVNP